jgi:hypothetical protein
VQGLTPPPTPPHKGEGSWALFSVLDTPAQASLFALLGLEPSIQWALGSRPEGSKEAGLAAFAGMTMFVCLDGQAF